MNANSSSPSPLCPTTRQLREWLEGEHQFNETELAHLKNCRRCADCLATLSDDDSLQLLANLSTINAEPAFAHEPELAKLRSMIRVWPLADSAARSTATISPPITERTAIHPAQAESSSPDALTTEALNRRLPSGRFVVDRLVAEGGTGAVYLAYDQQLQREVAIKVLSKDSLRDRQRFLREARLLAELEHPNIVRVFDFGTLTDASHGSSTNAGSVGTNGQLYIVMEYVSGGTTCLLLNNSSSDRLVINYPRLAHLMATAADGLAAAHARSLVHRDVKPGNLLLVADWSAIKVADFGLARSASLDATQVTRTGDLLGTPDYMSPEQVTAHATVDAASDIYSLGATLYQLLTGMTPYQGGHAAVLRQIAESSPVAPRLIVPTIPADLETICLHAMQSEPTARYSSMQHFAADLRSFARGETILARPVSTATKALRFLRRNQSFAAVLAACVALVCLLTIGSITAAIVFRYQNQQLTVAAEKESQAKRSAEEALKTSITAADELLLAVTTETEFLPRAPGSQEVTRKLLERARDYFRNFLDTNADNTALTYQLARAHAGLGEVAMRVGDTATLQRETEAALALIHRIPAGQIKPADLAQLKADTLVVLANHLTESGEAKRALPMLEQATEACRQVLGDTSSAIPAQLPAEQLELYASYAISLFGQGSAMTWVNKRAEALPLVKQARELFGQLRALQPQNPAHLRSAAACDMTLATIALDLNQAAESKLHLLDALALLEQVDEDDAISLRIRELKIKALTNLALAERRMGNNAESKAGYEAAIAETRRLIELEPGVPSHKWNLVVAALNSGGPDMELGNLEPLVERWQATVPVLDKLIADAPENQRYQQVKAMLQSNIAIILRDMGKLDEAIAPLQAATETLRLQAEQLDFSSESYLPVALNHYELASTFIQLKRWPEAQQALDASNAISREILAKDAKFTPAQGHLLDAMHARLDLLSKQSGVEIATRTELAEQSLQLARELSGGHPDVAEFQIEVPRALNDFALVHLAQSDYTAALDLTRQARQLLDGIQKSSPQQSTAESASPELRSAMKQTLLIEAQAIVGLDAKSLAPDQVASVRQLIQLARQFGATDEEVALFDDLIKNPP